MKEIIVKIVRENRLEYTADCPKECFAYWKQQIETRPDYDSDKEHFVVLCLDGKLNVKCHSVITIGLLNQTLVHAREVFRPAIACASSEIIIMHNHPGNCAKPSKEDIGATSNLVEAGKLLGIPICDHVIVTDKEFYSFRETGILNPSI